MISDQEPVSLDEIGHPKGTLAVLALYMLLFILGWAALYFGQFLPRGTPDGTPDETELHQTELHQTEVPQTGEHP